MVLFAIIKGINRMNKKYCNDGCKESYQTDRQMGLIYGGIAVYLSDIPAKHTFLNLPVHKSLNNPEKQFVVVGWEEGANFYKFCRYCKSPLV
jgi:hypothetical protein